MGPPVEEVSHAEPTGQLHNALFNRRVRIAADLEREGKVVADGHGGEEHTILRYVTDVPGRRPEMRHVDRPERWYRLNGTQPRDGFEDGRLAAAALAHEDGVLAGRHRERDAREREFPLANGEVGDLDQFSTGTGAEVTKGLRTAILFVSLMSDCVLR